MRLVVGGEVGGGNELMIRLTSAAALDFDVGASSGIS